MVHPLVVPVYSASHSGGHPYILVMEAADPIELNYSSFLWPLG
jgi:hypothetical protein